MNKNVLYPLLIIIASSSYGILSTIIKLAMEQGFTASEGVTSQYIFGFGLALILFIGTERKLPRLTRSGVFTLFFAGLFTAITGIVYGQALIYLPASLAVVMLFQFTWVGLFLDCILKRRMPTRPEVISLIILFIGTILAAGIFDTDLSSIPWQGWVFGFASALSFASFIQVNARPVAGVSTMSKTLIMSFVALIIVSIFLNPEIVWNGKMFGEGLWQYGLALGTFGVILPILLLLIAAPKVGGALTSILSAMELPVAITVSVIVLHESLTSLQMLGICFVLAGMILPTVLSQKKIA